ncbi:hypothetical protein P280DRAFT_386971, partial [Massarina eburnea CBS 473.64]
CVNTNLHSTACLPNQNGRISCDCRGALLTSPVQHCLASVCMPKRTLATINDLSEACNEPVRNRALLYRTVNLVLFVLAMTAMAIRFTTYWSAGRRNWLDDVNMGIVLVLDSVLVALCVKMSYLGLGQDMWKVPAEIISPTLLYFWISEIVYFLSLGFVKLAFLIFFLQIFPKKNFRRIVWAFITFTLLYVTATGTAAALICTPVSFAWEGWDGEHKGHCVNNNNLAFSHAGISIVLDFASLTLPVTQIWDLHMSIRKKIGVIMMFSVGSFVTVVSILRLRALVHFANTRNMTWDYLDASFWSVIEVQVGIVCACMPSIRLALARLFPKDLGSTHHSATKPTAGRIEDDSLVTGSGSSRHRRRSVIGDGRFGGIAVHTSVRVSHAKPQTGEQGRFVRLVEIGGDVDGKSIDSRRDSK